MQQAQLTQFLIDITRGHKKEGFAADANAVLAQTGLAPELQQAIREQDVAALWLAGASPMALLYFARLSGWDMPRYYDCVTQAELKKGA